MQTLSYGYLNPDNGDKGSVWFTALNADITQLNSHSHNGSDSSLVNAAYIVKGTVAISSGSWVSDGTGRYKQVVSVPSGFNMDDFLIQVKFTSSGDLVYPTISKTSTTSFTIYTSDNTANFTATFR
jgi:hypothetical protein